MNSEDNDGVKEQKAYYKFHIWSALKPTDPRTENVRIIQDP